MQTHCALCRRELYTGHEPSCPYYVEKEAKLTTKETEEKESTEDELTEGHDSVN